MGNTNRDKPGVELKDFHAVEQPVDAKQMTQQKAFIELMLKMMEELNEALKKFAGYAHGNVPLMYRMPWASKFDAHKTYIASNSDLGSAKPTISQYIGKLAVGLQKLPKGTALGTTERNFRNDFEMEPGEVLKEVDNIDAFMRAFLGYVKSFPDSKSINHTDKINGMTLAETIYQDFAKLLEASKHLISEQTKELAQTISLESIQQAEAAAQGAASAKLSGTK